MPSKFSNVMILQELVEHLRVPESTLYKLTLEGKMPGQEVRRH